MTRPILHRRGASYVLVAVIGAGTAAATAAPASAAALKGYQQVVTEFETGGPTQATGTVSCPAGSVVVGGGVGLTGSSALATSISGSHPSSDGTGWVGTIGNPNDAGTDYGVVAQCVKRSSSYTVVTGTAVTNPGGTQTAATASCPTKTVALGGGGSLSSTSVAVRLNDSYPLADGAGWRVDANNASGTSQTARAWAVCGKRPSKYKIVKGAGTAIGPMTTGSDFALCPTGSVPIGGGGDSSSASVTVNLFGTRGAGSGWDAEASDTGSTTSTITAYGICAKG